MDRPALRALLISQPIIGAVLAWPILAPRFAEAAEAWAPIPGAFVALLVVIAEKFA